MLHHVTKKMKWAIIGSAILGTLIIFFVIETKRWPVVTAGMDQEQVYAMFTRGSARYIIDERPSANTHYFVRALHVRGVRIAGREMEVVFGPDHTVEAVRLRWRIYL